MTLSGTSRERSSYAISGTIYDQVDVDALGDGDISFRCSCMASMSAFSNASAAPIPRAGQIAPNRRAFS